MGGVYVHIPFCRTHCTYCGFYSELLRDARGSECFVDALCREIESTPAAVRGTGGQEGLLPPWRQGDCRRQLGGPPRKRWEGSLPDPLCRGLESKLNTLYFGGGTPSLLTLEQMERILFCLGGGPWDEFTVEVNPDDIAAKGPEYALGLRRLGVSRISMGIQSFDDAVLKRMGRRHDSAQAKAAYEILRQAGFDNISVDFIFGFQAGMDAEALGCGLDSLHGGLPEHISCYQLSIEEGSGLGKMVEKGLYAMPEDSECERQYLSLCDVLRCRGYEHYEISNWAQPGRRSRHNSSYWNHSPYIGYGPGAHSLFVDGGRFVRRWNNPDLRSYLDAAGSGVFDTVRGEETLTPEQIREERIMLGLRTEEGIPSSLVGDNSVLVASPVPGNVRIPENRWFISDSIICNLI
ncbi:MAG: coproporphyrinogen III oxidase family protein [Bacteroidales bacterium]|nr:coproporphyrinogen III oxidase family protein [Bacteroidales bacterium]